MHDIIMIILLYINIIRLPFYSYCIAHIERPYCH